jgi:putative phosphoesterase
MKIGVISDIHSNLFALQKVLSEIEKHNVDFIINAGDNVGYSAFPNECIEILKKERIYCALGNYDDAVANNRLLCGCGEGDENTQKIRLASLQWTQKNTSEVNKKFLNSIPNIPKLEFNNNKILAMHGGLDELNEFIYPDQTDKLQNIAQNTDAEIIIMGHTHKSFVLELSGKLFVNPGSVGKPEEGSPHSSYAVIDINDKYADIYHASYNVEKNIDSIRKAGLPEEIIENLRTGVSFSKK